MDKLLKEEEYFEKWTASKLHIKRLLYLKGILESEVEELRYSLKNLKIDHVRLQKEVEHYRAEEKERQKLSKKERMANRKDAHIANLRLKLKNTRERLKKARDANKELICKIAKLKYNAPHSENNQEPSF